MDFIEVQLDDKVLEKVLDIEYGVDILPVLDSDVLANLVELVLLDPIFTRSLVEAVRPL